MKLCGPCFGLAWLFTANFAAAEPAAPALRAEVPAAVEAEIATREVLCKLDDLGALLIPKGALTRADLNADGSDEFILALCRLACAGNIPQISTACDQSLIFVSGAKGYQSLKMPGELLDIRRAPGAPARLLSSSISDHAACPVADGVCNPLYEIRNGELVQAGIE
jgi:hypothetical protein